MVQVCEGVKTKNDMLMESIGQYKEVFIRAKREFDKVVTVCLEVNDLQVGLNISNFTDRATVSKQ